MNSTEFEDNISAMDAWAESVRSELATIITDEPSKTIFHYTDVNGLTGIVSDGCVWATHSSRLNDMTENELGFILVKEHVINSFNGASRQLFEKALLEFKSVETYVACYSTENDLLGQWRSYTGDKVGYCLGFETKYMATIDDRMPILEKVIYNDIKAIELLDHLLQRVDDFLSTNPFGEVEVGYILGIIEATLSNFACIIKHHKFEEEREYRQIYQPEKTALRLERFVRNGQFGLTPYVKIGFLEKDRLPLKSVTIGPCKDFELEENSLRILLKQYDYGDVEIMKSKIPLRV